MLLELGHGVTKRLVSFRYNYNRSQCLIVEIHTFYCIFYTLFE